MYVLHLRQAHIQVSATQFDDMSTAWVPWSVCDGCFKSHLTDFTAIMLLVATPTGTQQRLSGQTIG